MKSKISKDVKTSISHYYFDCIPIGYDGDSDLAELDLTRFYVVITKEMEIKCVGQIGIDFRTHFTEPWNELDPFILWFDCDKCIQLFIIPKNNLSEIKSVCFDPKSNEIEVEF